MTDQQFDYEDDDDMEALEALLAEHPGLLDVDPDVILPPRMTNEVPEAWKDGES